MIIIERKITKVKNEISTVINDKIVVESPLQIEINGSPISITMRTPGDDEALAVGFLYCEGIIKDSDMIDTTTQKDPSTINILLSENVKWNPSDLTKNFYTTSSCGICGNTSLDILNKEIPFNIAKNNISIKSYVLYSLIDKLSHVQETFEATGGLHASALFNIEGRFLHHTEDVGRHNALDKLIGDSLLADRLPLDKHLLLLSGRASFELIQKAAMAGIAIVASVGAPSSLAIELAEKNGMTLLGFLKKTSFNIYCGHERILQ